MKPPIQEQAYQDNAKQDGCLCPTRSVKRHAVVVKKPGVYWPTGHRTQSFQQRKQMCTSAGRNPLWSTFFRCPLQNDTNSVRAGKQQDSWPINTGTWSQPHSNKIRHNLGYITYHRATGRCNHKSVVDGIARWGSENVGRIQRARHGAQKMCKSSVFSSSSFGRGQTSYLKVVASIGEDETIFWGMMLSTFMFSQSSEPAKSNSLTKCPAFKERAVFHHLHVDQVMMLELHLDEKHRAKGSTSETRMSNRWVKHVMRAALQACESSAFRQSVRHIVQHRQSRDGQIQLTTHQPRGQLRTQVLFKVANMCSVACEGNAFRTFQFCPSHNLQAVARPPSVYQARVRERNTMCVQGRAKTQRKDVYTDSTCQCANLKSL